MCGGMALNRKLHEIGTAGTGVEGTVASHGEFREFRSAFVVRCAGGDVGSLGEVSMIVFDDAG